MRTGLSSCSLSCVRSVQHAANQLALEDAESVAAIKRETTTTLGRSEN